MSRLSPVHNIRSLLTSRDLNEQFLFISCLGCLDPTLWAGTTSEAPAVLEAWEVEKVMQLLDSPDSLLRRKVSCNFNNLHINW
jgi:AP-4 complex subunit epsilon-1